MRKSQWGLDTEHYRQYIGTCVPPESTTFLHIGDKLGPKRKGKDQIYRTRGPYRGLDEQQVWINVTPISGSCDKTVAAFINQQSQGRNVWTSNKSFWTHNVGHLDHFILTNVIVCLKELGFVLSRVTLHSWWSNDPVRHLTRWWKRKESPTIQSFVLLSQMGQQSIKTTVKASLRELEGG